MHNRTFSLIISVALGLMLIFIIAPIAGIVFKTPLSDLFDTTSDKQVTNSILLTISASFTATFIFAVISLPGAWLLARRRFRLKRLVLGIIDLPVVIPHTAAGIALLGLVSRDSTVGRIATSIGIDFVGHPAGIVLAMAFVSLPFFVNAAREGFAAVPERLEHAALNLGNSPLKVFLTISIPLAARNIMSGAVMMFARGMSEFGAIVIIAYQPMTTPVLIFERFSSFGLQYARPVALLFIIISVILFLLMRLLTKDPENARN
ncbi:MAG: ABC transporter permease [Lentimicrobium sp.]|jgi:molybdate/tungstate transport system permease protein|nr:ABC transporter permease [Lentimicrobium sp.]